MSTDKKHKKQQLRADKLSTLRINAGQIGRVAEMESRHVLLSDLLTVHSEAGCAER